MPKAPTPPQDEGVITHSVERGGPTRKAERHFTDASGNSLAIRVTITTHPNGTHYSNIYVGDRHIAAFSNGFIDWYRAKDGNILDNHKFVDPEMNKSMTDAVDAIMTGSFTQEEATKLGRAFLITEEAMKKQQVVVTGDKVQDPAPAYRAFKQAKDEGNRGF